MSIEIKRTEDGGIDILDDGFLAASFKAGADHAAREWIKSRRAEAAQQAYNHRMRAEEFEREAGALDDLDVPPPLPCADCGEPLEEYETDYETEDGLICTDCAGERMARAEIEGER